MNPSFSELRATTQQNCTEFLKTDLDLCFTFIDVAHTELESMKNRDAAIRVIGKAEEGHATITRLLLHLDDGPEKETIQQQLIALRARLNSFQQRLHSAV